MKKKIIIAAVAVIVFAIIIWIVNTFYNIGNSSPKVDFGITLSVASVTKTGLTVIFDQKDGNVTDEINTGSYYVLETHKDGKWVELDYKDGLDAENIGWNSIAYIIKSNDKTEFNVNWDWLYGELEEGKYRIGKEVTSKDITEMFYAEFVIE